MMSACIISIFDCVFLKFSLDALDEVEVNKFVINPIAPLDYGRVALVLSWFAYSLSNSNSSFSFFFL